MSEAFEAMYARGIFQVRKAGLSYVPGMRAMMSNEAATAIHDLLLFSLSVVKSSMLIISPSAATLHLLLEVGSHMPPQAAEPHVVAHDGEQSIRRHAQHPTARMTGMYVL